MTNLFKNFAIYTLLFLAYFPFSEANNRCPGFYLKFSYAKYEILKTVPTEKIKIYTKQERISKFEDAKMKLGKSLDKTKWELAVPVGESIEFLKNLKGEIISGVTRGTFPNSDEVHIFAGEVIDVYSTSGDSMRPLFAAKISGFDGEQIVYLSSRLVTDAIHILKQIEKRTLTGNPDVDRIPAEKIKVYSLEQYDIERGEYRDKLLTAMDPAKWELISRNSRRLENLKGLKGETIAGITNNWHDTSFKGEMILIFAGKVLDVLDVSDDPRGHVFVAKILGAFGEQTVRLSPFLTRSLHVLKK